MRKGTTPTEVFELDTPELDMTTLTEVWTTITDAVGKAKTWDITRATINDEYKTISITLTQEETLAFTPGLATVDIRMLTSDDKAIATDYSTIEIHDTQKGGVIE